MNARLRLACAAGALLLAGCAGTDADRTHFVTVTEHGFEPAALVVAAGDEVRFVNHTTTRVTVTSVAPGDLGQDVVPPPPPRSEVAPPDDDATLTTSPDDAAATTQPGGPEGDPADEDGEDGAEDDGTGEDGAEDDGTGEDDGQSGEDDGGGDDDDDEDDDVEHEELDLEEATALPDVPAQANGGAPATGEGDFDSGPLVQGEAFALRLDRPGQYLYGSTPQRDLNWFGTITVEEP